MLETSKKLVNATTDVTDCLKTVMAKEMNIEDITPETLALLQSYSKFVRVSNEYVAKTAEMMTEIDKKLETLLTRTKELH